MTRVCCNICDSLESLAQVVPLAGAKLAIFQKQKRAERTSEVLIQNQVLQPVI